MHCFWQYLLTDAIYANILVQQRTLLFIIALKGFIERCASGLTFLVSSYFFVCLLGEIVELFVFALFMDKDTNWCHLCNCSCATADFAIFGCSIGLN